MVQGALPAAGAGGGEVMTGPPVHYCPDCDCYPCCCWRHEEAGESWYCEECYENNGLLINVSDAGIVLCVVCHAKLEG